MLTGVLGGRRGPGSRALTGVGRARWRGAGRRAGGSCKEVKIGQIRGHAEASKGFEVS